MTSEVTLCAELMVKSEQTKEQIYRAALIEIMEGWDEFGKLSEKGMSAKAAAAIAEAAAVGMVSA